MLLILSRSPSLCICVAHPSLPSGLHSLKSSLPVVPSHYSGEETHTRFSETIFNGNTLKQEGWLTRSLREAHGYYGVTEVAGAGTAAIPGVGEYRGGVIKV